MSGPDGSSIKRIFRCAAGRPGRSHLSHLPPGGLKGRRMGARHLMPIKKLSETDGFFVCADGKVRQSYLEEQDIFREDMAALRLVPPLADDNAAHPLVKPQRGIADKAIDNHAAVPLSGELLPRR